VDEEIGEMKTVEEVEKEGGDQESARAMSNLVVKNVYKVKVKPTTPMSGDTTDENRPHLFMKIEDQYDFYSERSKHLSAISSPSASSDSENFVLEDRLD
jgi:hypothetical protein